VAELRQQAQKHLPHYMVPAALVLLETLPLTPNGKVDRRALPAPDSIVHASEDTYVAPTKIVHYQLIQIWEELLNVHSIGIRDNFFYLGGHSLLAARLIERIEQVCGKKIPLATLFAGPTIEQLADALQQQEDIGARTPIVAIRASGTRRPIFFLHGDWTGGPFYCFALGRALEPDQPFYTLEPYRLDEQEIPPTLEAMAAAHLRSLRVVQPEGPYLLGGFCNGGLLAYEMARQLRAEGQQVDLLFLINPTPPAGYRFLYNLVNRFSRVIQLRRDQQAVCFLRLRHALRHIYRYLHSANDSRLADFDKLLAVDPRLDSMFPPAEALRKDYIGVITWLNSDYLPDLYPGKVTFFLAREEAFLKGLWRTVAKASVVEGHVIPGTHISCVTEYTDDLAELLRACRDRAQAEVSSH
jgi:thioesterase domain-containing protein